MIDRIASWLQLEPRETRRALGLAALLFVISASYTLAKTGRDAIYLAHLPASTLPYVYLGVGVLTTAFAAVYTRLTRRQAPGSALETAVWSAALSLALFGALFRTERHWVAVSFYLWVNFYGVLLLSQFWAYTNSLSHAREAKRIFGFIGGGGILGGLFGGLAVAPLAHAYGLGALLYAGAGIVALAGIGLRWRGPAMEVPHGATPEEAPAEGGNPLRHPYVRWLALAALCSVLVGTLIDYQFKIELQRRQPTPEGLASFIGLFYTATNLAALTMQLFATRWALQTLGAGWSSAVLPTGLGVGAAFTLLVPGFATVITTRLWDQVMRLSINKSAVELFYFPLEPGLRRRAQALIEAGIERIGDALAGLLILAVAAVMGAGTRTTAGIVLVLVLVWVVAWLRVRRGYVTELGRNLRRLNLALPEAQVSLREASMLEEMERLLESPYERVVLHGIVMLDENAPERLLGRIGALLGHPSAAVRALSLAHAGPEPPDAIRERIAELLNDSDPDVRIAALRAHWAQGGEDRMALLQELLDSTIPRVRRSALESLAELALPSEEGGVRTVLEASLRDGDEEDRAAVSRGLGARPGPSALHDLLPPLLEDVAVPVRRAALAAAGRAGLRRMVPRMIDALAQRQYRDASRQGLTSFGSRVAGTLGDYLCDASVPLALRREIPRVLGNIGGAEAVAALTRCRERDDVRLAYRVLKAANRVRSTDPLAVFPRGWVTEDLEFEAHSYLFALVHYRMCPIGTTQSAERLLCIALNERMDQALNRMFRRLALLYPSRDIHAAYAGVISESPRLRGNALEYLENALHADHRPLVLPVVNDSGDRAKLDLAERRYGLKPVGYEATLRALLVGGDSWLRTCSLYVVGTRRERGFLGVVEEQLASRDPHVRETAAWARLALAGT